MSDHVSCEECETEPSTDYKYEESDWDSCIHTSAGVVYYRCFEYCVKWEIPMYPRRSSSSAKSSKKRPQRSPSTKKNIPLKSRDKRQRTGLRKTKVDNSIADADEGRARDIIDIIDRSHDDKHVAEEKEDELVELADEGLDHSDEDFHPFTSSISSGPYSLRRAAAKRPSQGMCLACQKLYQRAKKMKAPIKNKLFDNDPKSLTCDQWVLIKEWRPRRLPNARGKLLKHVQIVKKISARHDAKRTEQSAEGEEQPACCRPHTFLQRNLRRQKAGVPVQKGSKKNKRKRKRDHSQGQPASKQQRRYSDQHHQPVNEHPSLPKTDNNGSYPTGSRPGFESLRDDETDDPEDTHVTVELISSKVTLEPPSKPRAQPERKARKKTAGFKDLLTQMRGNSSMIIRETR